MPTTARIFYWHDAGGRIFTEHLDVTYHFSEIYGEHETGRTITDARDVGCREMMKTIAIYSNEFGCQPW